MKTRPILFNGAMVRAVLAGTKTQTRRALKPQPREDKSITSGRGELAWQTSVGHFIVSTLPTAPKLFVERCPYGKPGDRLWVREAFDPIYGQCPPDHIIEVDYRADWEPNGKHWRMKDEMGLRRWKPSIHMPRDLSRITLEIVSVRVERLQDISEADATAEGTPHSLSLPAGRLASENYAHLWECINGDRSWAANPWVWVVEFKRVDQ